MKKIFLFVITVFISATLFAETNTDSVLANFENGLDQDIQTAGMAGWTKITIDFDSIATNPMKDDVNDSGKCWVVTETGNGSNGWWGNFLNFQFVTERGDATAFHDNGMIADAELDAETLAGAVVITEDIRFLHVMHYRSDLTSGFMMSINTTTNRTDAEAGTFRFDSNNSEAGVWQDHVFDLKSLIDAGVSLRMITFCVNKAWGGAVNPTTPTTYAFDNFVLTNSAIPRGVTIIEGADNVLDCSDTAKINSYAINSGDYGDSINSYEFIDNPFTSDAINAGGKVAKFTKGDSATWWKGFDVKFNGMYLIETGVTQYLHVLVKADTSMVIQLNMRNNIGIEFTQDYEYDKATLDEYGYGFYDLVMDLGEHQGIQQLTVRADIQEKDSVKRSDLPERTIYIDEIIIDGNPDQRFDVISSAIQENRTNTFAPTIYTFNKQITINGDGLRNVIIYNIGGQKVIEEPLSQSNTINISNTGIYILKIKTTTGDYMRKVIIN